MVPVSAPIALVAKEDPAPVIPVEKPNETAPSPVTPSSGNARPIQRTKTSLDLKSLQAQRPSPPAVQPESNQPESAPVPVRESSPESILKAWRDFAESRKDQVAEYMLLQRPINIKGNSISMTLGNAVEEPLLEGFRSDLLGWIREALGNPGITLETSLQVEAVVRSAYTNREKLDELKGRYPAVGELVERLGLDPDF